MKKFITFPISATESRPVDIEGIILITTGGATVRLHEKTGTKEITLTFQAH